MGHLLLVGMTWSQDFAVFFLREVFAKLGIPEDIVADRGLSTAAEAVQDYLDGKAYCTSWQAQ